MKKQGVLWCKRAGFQSSLQKIFNCYFWILKYYKFINTHYWYFYYYYTWQWYFLHCRNVCSTLFLYIPLRVRDFLHVPSLLLQVLNHNKIISAYNNINIKISIYYTIFYCKSNCWLQEYICNIIIRAWPHFI